MLDALKITEAVTIKVKEETESVGSKLLIFYIPHKASIYDDLWHGIERKYGITDAYWSMDKVGTEMKYISERNAIDFVNPTELVRSEANKLILGGKRLYFARDGHWNADGHKLVGEILAEYINSHYLMNNN